MFTIYIQFLRYVSFEGVTMEILLSKNDTFVMLTEFSSTQDDETMGGYT